jgi:hypothetical protein
MSTINTREKYSRQHVPDLPSAGAKWNDMRVIVFTEWEDTRRYLQQQINAAIADTDRAAERMAVYCGSTPARRTEGDESRVPPGVRGWSV